MTQPGHNNSKQAPKEKSDNTGATVGTGYEDKQGDYPAYTGRIAEATESAGDTQTTQPADSKHATQKPS